MLIVKLKLSHLWHSYFLANIQADCLYKLCSYKKAFAPSKLLKTCRPNYPECLRKSEIPYFRNLEPSQTYKKEIFTKKFICRKPLAIFAKSSILDIWLDWKQADGDYLSMHYWYLVFSTSDDRKLMKRYSCYVKVIQQTLGRESK